MAILLFLKHVMPTNTIHYRISFGNVDVSGCDKGLFRFFLNLEKYIRKFFSVEFLQ